MDTGGIRIQVDKARQPVPRTNAPESNPQAVSGFVPYRVVVATKPRLGCLVVEPPKLKNMVIKWSSNLDHFPIILRDENSKNLWNRHPETYIDVHVEVEHIHLKHWKLSSHCEAVQLMYEDVKLQATRPWQWGNPQGTQWKTSWNRKVFRFDSGYRSDMIWPSCERKMFGRINGLTKNVFEDGPTKTKRKGLLFAFGQVF